MRAQLPHGCVVGGGAPRERAAQAVFSPIFLRM
jgi:hypothetical protein